MPPGATHIKPRLALALAGCALAPAFAAAGCGSGSSSSPVLTTTTVRETATGTSTPTVPSAGAGSGTITGETTPSGSSLKATGKPKYGTPPASSPAQSGLVNIAYREISIHPDTLRVKAGTTVRWTNYDPVEHNVTSEGGPQHFASKNFGEGQSFEVKLTKPGTIHYLCTIHPASMNGTIVVVR